MFSRSKRIDALQQELIALRTRLDDSEAERVALIERIGTMERQASERRADVEARLAEIPPPAASQSLAAVDERVSTLDAARAELTRRLDEFVAATNTHRSRIEARLAEVSGHVTNQIDELGGEIEAARTQAAEAFATATKAQLLAEEAASRPDVAPEVLDGLTSAQARLASEQVRYDLALRAELAELADRLRRANR
jgi:hypothetical protein